LEKQIKLLETELQELDDGIDNSGLDSSKLTIVDYNNNNHEVDSYYGKKNERNNVSFFVNNSDQINLQFHQNQIQNQNNQKFNH